MFVLILSRAMTCRSRQCICFSRRPPPTGKGGLGEQEGDHGNRFMAAVPSAPHTRAFPFPWLSGLQNVPVLRVVLMPGF